MSDSTSRADAGKKALPSDRVMAEIRQMIGLEDIKKRLDRLVAFGELIKLRRERDIPADKIGLHMVFTGSPGTGKTVLARKFGELFKSIGLLREGHVVEVDRSTLLGTHVGDAEKLTRDAFERARNGVLFIDEAYALGGVPTVSSGEIQPNSFAKGVTDTLVKLMEDNRSNVSVIVAGYPDDMKKYLASNPGLKSRFAMNFSFPSYLPNELLKIFDSMAEAANYTVEPDARTEVRHFIDGLDIEARTFGNAREIRIFLESLLPVQAVRIAGIPDFRNLPNSELLTITRDDVREAIEGHGTRL